MVYVTYLYLNKFVRGKCSAYGEIWGGQESVQATKLDEIKVNNNENVTKCIYVHIAQQ